MEIQQFAEMTWRVIEKDRFADYQPTLCLPAQRHVTALAGIPAEEGANIRTISLNWAIKTADQDEEFLLAFKETEASFRIIRRNEGQFFEDVFPSSR
jgi:hypothetical protein